MERSVNDSPICDESDMSLQFLIVTSSRKQAALNVGTFISRSEDLGNS